MWLECMPFILRRLTGLKFDREANFQPPSKKVDVLTKISPPINETSF